MYEQRSEEYFGPVFQIENTMTKQQRANNYNNLLLNTKIPVAERKLIGAIYTHLNSLRLITAKDKLIQTFYNSVKDAKNHLHSNELELDYTFCDYYDIVTRSNYKDTWQGNNKYKQTLKAVEKRGIIKNIVNDKSKFTYIVNPLIIYFYKDSSCKFGDVYIKWNELNNITIDKTNDPYLNKIYKQRSNLTGRLCIVDPPKETIDTTKDKIYYDSNGDELPF
jgi:hypothetical protein